MKQNKFTKLLAVFLASALIACTFTGCTGHGKKIMSQIYGLYNNLALGSTVTSQDGKTSSTFKLSGKAEETKYATIDLGKETDFNTVVLKESGSKITLFEIYGSNSADSDYDFLYQSDCIEGGHTCFLGDVSYRYLRIFVNMASGNFKLTGAEVYNIKSDKAKNLRVNTYLVAANINENTDFSMLDGVTDIIMFGTAKFDKLGNIIFVDDSGNTISEDIYAQKVEILKNAVGNRKINLICDIAMPYNDNNADIISMLSEENVGNTIASIKAFVEKYGFDGYDMDYEFPNSKKEWKLFNSFLRQLDSAIPDKIISLAIAPWDLQFDDDVIEIIDRAEVMLYDMFTAHGYHATFPVSVNGINKMLEGGFKAEQLDFGVPFYSRPTDRHAYWGDYSQYENKLDRFTNLFYYNGFDHDGAPMTAPQYLNSAQMIADKTAFAIDAGLGGIMIWHMTCDLPYDNEFSLFKSINDTKTAKQ